MSEFQKVLLKSLDRIGPAVPPRRVGEQLFTPRVRQAITPRRPVEDEQGIKHVETEYRRRPCAHVWTERIPAPPEPQGADEAA